MSERTGNGIIGLGDRVRLVRDPQMRGEVVRLWRAQKSRELYAGVHWDKSLAPISADVPVAALDRVRE